MPALRAPRSSQFRGRSHLSRPSAASSLLASPRALLAPALRTICLLRESRTYQPCSLGEAVGSPESLQRRWSMAPRAPLAQLGKLVGDDLFAGRISDRS